MRHLAMAGWFFYILSAVDGYQENVGAFKTYEECERERKVYATKFYGWIAEECHAKPVAVILVPTGSVQP